MSTEHPFEIQRPASEVEQLIARARRCLTPQQAAGLDEQLRCIRAHIAAGSFESVPLYGMTVSAAQAATHGARA